MKKVWIRVTAALSILGSTGCSASYWPLLNDEGVVLFVRGSYDAGEIDGDVFRGSVQLCLRNVDHGWPCGARLVPEGYDEDRFVIEQDELGSFEVECLEDGDIYEGIKLGECRVLVQKADEGMEFRGVVNDVLLARVTMPARSRPTSPKNGSVISVSSVDGIPLSWAPGQPGELLMWSLNETFSIDGSCGQDPDVVWAEESGGKLEDTGSFTIPKELLPTNLPPGGCSVDITLIRSQDHALEPTIKTGFARGQQYGTVEVILKP